MNTPSVWLCTRRVRLKDAVTRDGRHRARYATYRVLRWYGREIDPETGKPKLYSESLGKVTKAEAERKRREKIADLSSGAALIDKPGRMTLAAFRALYEDRRARPDGGQVHQRHRQFRRLTRSTLKEHAMTLRYLIQHFGADRLIEGINAMEAGDFIDALEGGKLADAREKVARGQKLGEQRIRHHIRNAKTIFSWARTFGLVTVNPFEAYDGKPLPTRPLHYVSRIEFEALIAKAESPGLRTLYALCRLAGLRLGEALALGWDQPMQDRDGVTRDTGVDWARRRLCVVAEKTGMYREVPMSPRLLDVLRDVREAAPDDQITVCGLGRRNLCRIGKRTAEAAGLTPWRKFHHAMRKSCEDDWKSVVAEATYCAWLGHSPNVSRKHYVSPTDDEYAAITGTAA